MALPVTEDLADYLDRLPYSMEVLAERAGGGLTVWYRIRRNRKGWLADPTVAMLARGLGITEPELARIALGWPKASQLVDAGPIELRELSAAYGGLDAGTQDMVMAVARAALKKRGGASRQVDAESA
jgi:hypothetical protein